MLQTQVLADVPHAQWVFSIPKMLRPYFLHHRELLGDMARLAYDTVCEMMAAATFDVDEPSARPGMVGVIQTFASSLKWNPHIHSYLSARDPPVSFEPSCVAAVAKLPAEPYHRPSLGEAPPLLLPSSGGI